MAVVSDNPEVRVTVDPITERKPKKKKMGIDWGKIRVLGSL